jgi:D-alanyl-D-alanine carboxypeptidase (penicillin-binding protein 5/6)
LKQLKKAMSTILAIFIIAGMFTSPVYSSEPEPELKAETAVLIEAETGTVLYAKAADKPMAPASLTKIMTLLLAMEELKRGRVEWDTPIAASQRAWETGGSTMFLNIGQTATFRQMIQGIAIVSANDACVAVAEHLFGSEDAFVQQMNRRAADLGLENTNFTNTHGLHHPDQYMSALDAAKLAAYFIKTQPEAAAYQSEREFTFNEIRQFNRNPLLGAFPGADGVKTGSTPEAGMCLVASSIQEGMRLVSVVMNTASDQERKEDSEVLLSYGFRNYELVTIHEAGAIAAFAAVNRGRIRELPLVARQPVAAVAPRGNENYTFTEQLILANPVEAPVEAGEPIGTLQMIGPDGRVVSEVELFAAEEVERLGFFRHLFRLAGDFFAGLWRQVRS